MPKSVLPADIAGVSKSVGPYSQGVVGMGRRELFLAGQLATDEEGNFVGEGDIAAQYEHVMSKIARLVEAAGGTMDDVCSLVNYSTIPVRSTDPAYERICEIRRGFFDGDFPTSTWIEVAGLMHPLALVEIEARAVLD